MELIHSAHLNELVALLGKDMINQIRLNFVQDSQEKLEQLFQAWQIQDMTALRSLSHSLKSASANMALLAFSKEMATLEKHIAEKDIKSIQSQFEHIPALYQNSINALESHFD